MKFIFDFRYFRYVFYVVIFLLIWELFAYFNPNILPHFWGIVLSVVIFVFSKKGLLAILLTTMKVFIGIGAAFILGIGIAILLSESKYIKEVVLPIFTTFQSAPPISWIIIAIIWFGITPIPSIVAIFITTLPIISIPIYYGIKEARKEYGEVCKIYRLSKKDTIRYVIIPSVFSHIVSGLRVAVGFSFRIGITAEFFSDRDGIGYYMSWAYYNMEMSKIFAYTLIAIIISAVFSLLVEKGFQKLEKMIVR